MQQPAEKVRAASDRRKKTLGLPGAKLMTGRPDKSVDVSDSSFAVADGTMIPLRIYRPSGAAGRTLPVVVAFHGGGWISGDSRQSEWWNAGIAAGAQVVVVSVDYRLAPEHRFPVPLEDCYAGVQWVAEHGKDLGIDASRIAVMGDSAGGNLAAAVALMARDRGGPPLAAQILVYPSVDLGADYPSKDENAHAPILGRTDVDTTWRHYVESDADGKDPYASPLFAEHHDLPRALIQTAQYDPLRDQGPAYAAALRQAGVPVRLTNYVAAVHGFTSLPNVTVGGRQAMAEACAELRDAFSTNPVS